MQVAIAAIETSSIAQGAVVGDAMVKTAEIELVEARTLSPGKFWVLVTGGVAEVRAAHARGVQVAAETLLDQILIPQLHAMVPPALAGPVAGPDHDALGVIETLSAASAILAADRAAKTAPVLVRLVRLANGLGGKGYVHVTGDVADVQAAVEAGRAEAQAAGLLVRSVVIPRLASDMKTRLWG